MTLDQRFIGGSADPGLLDVGVGAEEALNEMDELMLILLHLQCRRAPEGSLFLVPQPKQTKSALGFGPPWCGSNIARFFARFSGITSNTSGGYECRTKYRGTLILSGVVQHIYPGCHGPDRQKPGMELPSWDLPPNITPWCGSNIAGVFCKISGPLE